jgi:hypothetical protein
MSNTPSGFTICLTLDLADPEPIRLRCEHCGRFLAETFGQPNINELTTSAHSHRKVCP